MPYVRLSLVTLILGASAAVLGLCLRGPSMIVVMANAAPAPSAPTAADTAKDDLVFEQKVVPFLKQYCTTCHNDVKQSAGLDLTPFINAATAKKDRDTWLKVQEEIASKAMPPKSKPQPNITDRTFVAGYLQEHITKLDCTIGKNPGRVTIRRLNRNEYNNTIRDLVGIDFQPANDFPSDDVGYGFDNIGDVLSMPTILLEKYLAAAEQIVNRAVVQPLTVPSSKQTFRPQNLIVTQKEFKERARIFLHSNGMASINFTVPIDGDYIIRVKAWAYQAGPDKAKMAVRLGEREIKTFDVDATEAKPQVYEVKLSAKEGGTKIGAAFLNDFYDKDAKDPNQRDRNLAIGSIEIEGPIGGASRPIPESHRRIMIAEPTGNGEAAARTILANFARKAWRRPVEASELDRLMKLVRLAREQNESFAEQIKLALRAVLVSPNFLFRIEKDQPGKSIYPVTDLELASRLSYFLWASMPDEELMRLAEQGKLRDRAVLEQQVRRMLADAKSRSMVENFAGQWLNLRLLTTAAPDRKTYPSFDAPLQQAMLRETEMFFEHVMRENRSILEFLDANYTFVNERLAKHYGIAGIKGEAFQKVSLPDTRRGGILTQGSILTLTSNPTRTSPVKRGKWVMDNILGTPPLPPPPDAGELKEDAKTALSGSLRQRMEQHRKNPNCITCHEKMDPLGFGLENFDGVGAWRANDGAFKIDSSGVMPNGATFDGPAGLRKVLLGKSDQFRRCLSEKLLTYALGRGLESYDQCAVDEIVKRLQQHEDRFPHLVLAIVESDPFQQRRSPVKE